VVAFHLSNKFRIIIFIDISRNTCNKELHFIALQGATACYNWVIQGAISVTL